MYNFYYIKKCSSKNLLQLGGGGGGGGVYTYTAEVPSHVPYQASVDMSTRIREHFMSIHMDVIFIVLCGFLVTMATSDLCNWV